MWWLRGFVVIVCAWVELACEINESCGWVFIREEGRVKDVRVIGIYAKVGDKLEYLVVVGVWSKSVGKIIEVEQEASMWLTMSGIVNYRHVVENNRRI